MKFKGIKSLKNRTKKVSKKRANKKKFPSISRVITENENFFSLLNVLEKMAIIFIFLSTFTFLMFTSVDLYRSFVKYENLNNQRQKLTSEISLLKSFSVSYKNSKEVYLQIAVREYELGDFKSAGFYLQKALYIDPNYEDALVLQKTLEGK